MIERPDSPFDLRPKEQEILKSKGLVGRWIREGPDARGEAHIERAKRLGYSRLTELDRRVGDQHIYVMSQSDHDKRQKQKSDTNREIAAKQIEASGTMVEEVALNNRGIRPVGRIGGTDVDFDKRLRLKGRPVPIHRSQEE